MSNDLAIMVPTRRPHNIARLLDDLLATQTQATLVLGVDADDDYNEYEALHRHPYWRDTRIVINARTQPGMVEAINTIFHAIKNDYTHFVFLGDDVRLHTPHWDQIVLTTLNAHEHAVVYWNDLHYGQDLCTHWAVTGNTVRTWGTFAPTSYHHLYLDNLYMRLGQDIDSLHYLPEVVIEHLHPGWGKSSWDANYLLVNNSDFYDHDHAAHGTYLTSEDYTQLIATLKGK